MNYSIAMFALLIMAGGHLSSFTTSSSDQKEEILVEAEPYNSNNMKCKKKIIEINGLKGKYIVKVGQQLSYAASVHGSVGYSASVQSSDDEALPLNKSFIEYDDKRKAKMPGGDSATKYFIFDTKKAGTYEILAQHYFRGDLEDDFTIVITVEE